MAKKKRKRSVTPRITLQDVATAAGVSLGAASAALRGAKRPIGVSQEKRERILKIARELNYRPNAAARAMAGHAFKTMGVLAAEYCFGSYFGRVLRAIVIEAEQRGYNVLIKMAESRMDLHNTRIFAEELIDGVIVPAETEPSLVEALNQFNIPHVWVHAGVDDTFNCVLPDEQAGMDLLLDHLAALGHRRVAYMPHDDPPSSDAHLVATRRQCYHAGMRARGLEAVVTPEPAMDPGDAVAWFLARQPRPTAIVNHSDALAARTCAALLDRGVRIPADMSVAGNDGVVWHHYVYPQLTTVCAPVHDLGCAAVQMLMEQIANHAPVPSVKIAPKLEVNASTGPAPQR